MSETKCECPARAALERLRGAGDRKVLDGSVLFSAPFLDNVTAALSAPCPCERLRIERNHACREAFMLQKERDQLRAELAEAEKARDQYCAEADKFCADADRLRSDLVAVHASGACGHVWDKSLHRSCPRCAIAEIEDRFRRVRLKLTEAEKIGPSVYAGAADAHYYMREAVRECIAILLVGGPSGPDSVSLMPDPAQSVI